MQLIGLFLGILIGVLLGLIGGGGSIFTIPVLVYLMNISPLNATTYSLLIVGVSALVGAVKGAKNKLLDYKMAIYFGLPSIVSVFIMRKFLIPLLPNVFFKVADFEVSKEFFILLVFAILMILASFSMIKKTVETEVEKGKINFKILILKGFLVGLLTGFVGVGGGFLIVPTLLLTANLPMKKAVATSLIIIAFNSLIGFAGSINNTPINWVFLVEFTAFSVIGIFVGMLISKKISSEKLRPVFGWFVLFTGIYIVINELFLKQ